MNETIDTLLDDSNDVADNSHRKSFTLEELMGECPTSIASVDSKTNLVKPARMKGDLRLGGRIVHCYLRAPYLLFDEKLVNLDESVYKEAKQSIFLPGTVITKTPNLPAIDIRISERISYVFLASDNDNAEQWILALGQVASQPPHVSHGSSVPATSSVEEWIASETGGALKSGYLLKSGSSDPDDASLEHGHTFYFECKMGQLAWFRSTTVADTQRPEGVLALYPSPPEMTQRANTVEVKVKGGAMVVLVAGSEDEAMDWHEALQRASGPALGSSTSEGIARDLETAAMSPRSRDVLEALRNTAKHKCSGNLIENSVIWESAIVGRRLVQSSKGGAEVRTIKLTPMCIVSNKSRHEDPFALGGRSFELRTGAGEGKSYVMEAETLLDCAKWKASLQDCIAGDLDDGTSSDKPVASSPSHEVAHDSVSPSSPRDEPQPPFSPRLRRSCGDLLNVRNGKVLFVTVRDDGCIVWSDREGDSIRGCIEVAGCSVWSETDSETTTEVLQMQYPALFCIQLPCNKCYSFGCRDSKERTEWIQTVSLTIKRATRRAGMGALGNFSGSQPRCFGWLGKYSKRRHSANGETLSVNDEKPKQYYFELRDPYVVWFLRENDPSDEVKGCFRLAGVKVISHQDDPWHFDVVTRVGIKYKFRAATPEQCVTWKQALQATVTNASIRDGLFIRYADSVMVDRVTSPIPSSPVQGLDRLSDINFRGRTNTAADSESADVQRSAQSSLTPTAKSAAKLKKKMAMLATRRKRVDKIEKLRNSVMHDQSIAQSIFAISSHAQGASSAVPSSASLSEQQIQSTPGGSARGDTSSSNNMNQSVRLEINDFYGFRVPNKFVDEFEKFADTFMAHLQSQSPKMEKLLENPEFFTSASLSEVVRAGIPPKWRGNLWLQLSGVDVRLKQHSGVYAQLLSRVEAGQMDREVLDQIDKDINRTFPNLQDDEEHKESIHRILSAFSLKNEVIGYTQFWIVAARMLQQWRREWLQWQAEQREWQWRL